MQDDVERVARAIFESDGQSWSEVGTAKSWYLDAARAAMAATREIDAETLRELTAERDAAAAEVAQIVSWLRNNMPSTMADLSYEADAIAAGAHKQEQ